MSYNGSIPLQPEIKRVFFRNPFDVSGARAQGMNAIWVDRAKKGWTDQLGLGPTKIVNDLREIPALIRSMSSKL